MVSATNMVSSTARAETERVYRDQGRRLWRALYAYSGNSHVADEAMSEAFAQLLGRGDAVRDPEHWVWRAAFRIAAGELARATAPIHALQAGVYEPAEVSALMAALARLSPMQRGSVLLHYYVGHPTKEVAEILGSTPAAIRVHLVRARKRLRKELEVEDE